MGHVTKVFLGYSVFPAQNTHMSALGFTEVVVFVFLSQARMTLVPLVSKMQASLSRSLTHCVIPAYNIGALARLFP